MLWIIVWIIVWIFQSLFTSIWMVVNKKILENKKVWTIYKHFCQD